MQLRHHLTRKLLYHRQIDDSPGTIATDFLFGTLMLLSSFIIAFRVVKNSRHKRQQRVCKSESGDEMIKNDAFAHRNAKLGEVVETGAVLASFLLFSYGLMFFVGGFIHNDVQNLDLEVSEEGNFYEATMRAYGKVLPYRMLWSFCCLCAGLVGCFFVLMCASAVSTRNEIRRNLEKSEKSSCEGALEKISRENVSEATENAIGLLTKSVAIVVFLATLGSELHKIVSFNFRRMRNQELVDLLNLTSLTGSSPNSSRTPQLDVEGFQPIDWSNMWPMFLPTIMLLAANLVHAVLAVYLQIRNSIQRSEEGQGEIFSGLNRGLWAQSVGSALMCLGGVLQVSLATLTDMSGHHHDGGHQGLPWAFNHNAIYHITTGFGALVLAWGHFVCLKICRKFPRIGGSGEVSKEFVVEL